MKTFLRRGQSEDGFAPAADGPALVYAGGALWGLHMGLTQGLLATMVTDTAPATLRGTAFGAFNLVSGATLLVASVLAGLLWDRFGATATFAAGAILSMLSLLGFARIGDGTKQQP